MVRSQIVRWVKGGTMGPGLDIVRRAALGKVDQRMKVGGEFIGQGLG